jgi:transcriptional regulator with XRE-family HTH domain
VQKLTLLNMNENQFYEVLGSNISSIRIKKGLKQEELANHLGLSRPSIVNIEKGNQRPTLFTVLQIARFLNVEVTHLIPEEKRNPFEGVSIFGLGIDKAKILNENSNVYTFLQSI